MLLPGSFSGVVPWTDAVPFPNRVCNVRCLVNSMSAPSWLAPAVGLAAMLERLSEINASLVVESSPAGTRLRAIVPLGTRRTEQEETAGTERKIRNSKVEKPIKIKIKRSRKRKTLRKRKRGDRIVV